MGRSNLKGFNANLQLGSLGSPNSTHGPVPAPLPRPLTRATAQVQFLGSPAFYRFSDEGKPPSARKFALASFIVAAAPSSSSLVNPAAGPHQRRRRRSTATAVRGDTLRRCLTAASADGGHPRPRRRMPAPPAAAERLRPAAAGKGRRHRLRSTRGTSCGRTPAARKMCCKNVL